MAVKQAEGLAAPAPAERSGSVRAVERAVELLFRLASHPEGIGLQRLAAEVGCSKSTVHRLLATLQGLGVVEQDGRLREYRLGQRVRELAGQGDELRRAALPLMRELVESTAETVTLHVIEGDSHVVIEQCESPHEIRRILPLGQAVPLLTGATARAILAFLPSDRTQQTLARTRTTRESGPSMAQLAEVRERGYSLSPGERIAGGTALSAPIFDRSGDLCAALSLSGPRFRLSSARAARFAPLLVGAAARISHALGFRQPRSRSAGAGA